MTRHRHVNTALLPFLVFFIAFVLHRPFDGGGTLYQNPSDKPHASTIILADEIGLSIPFNDHEIIPQLHAGHNLHRRVDTTEPSEAFNKAIVSGNSLMCIMKMTQEAAAAWALKSPNWATKHPVLSHFNNPSDLHVWG